MKKIAMMIAALVMTLSANAQFEQGKMYVGASMTGFDASYSGATEFHLGIDAKAGYFFMDNLLALGQVGYKHNGYGIFLGAGAKYVHSSGYNDFMPNVEVGYAFFINRTVTIEPALYYDQSIKNHSDYSTVGLRIGIGINLFKDTPKYFR